MAVKSIPHDRGITDEEVAVLEWMLLNASVVGSLEHLVPALRQLRVVGRCACGCVSVTFVQHDPENPSKLIADAFGETPTGLEMGLIVWGRTDAVTGLEVYEGDPLSNRSLPRIGSLRKFDPSRNSFEVAGRRCTILALDLPSPDPKWNRDRPFVCFLWDAGTRADVDERRALAAVLVDSACRGVVCGGSDSQAWHDSIDEAWEVLQSVQGAEIGSTLITTWHDEESLEDVAHFALHGIDPDHHVDVIALLLGGNEDLERATRAAFLETS